MRITSGGNLLVGTTTDAGFKLDVNGTGRFSGAVTINGDLNFDSAGATKYLNINQGTSADGGIILKRANSNRWQIAQTISGDNLNFYSFGTSNDVFRLNYSTAAATFNGNLSVIRTSGGSVITAQATATNGEAQLVLEGKNSSGTVRNATFKYDNADIIRIGTSSNIAMRFETNDVERMRITSDGYLKASNTGAYLSSGEPYHEFSSNRVNYPALLVWANSGDFGDQAFSIYTNRNTTNNTYYAISYYNIPAAAYKFRVADSGNVTNTNNSYGAISDIKLKENIIDSSPKLQDLLKVKVKNFNFIGSEEKQIGVIAQELEEIFPAMIDESPDKDKDGNDLGTTTKSVKYSVFVPMLIKAIQELKAELDELKSKN
jgi:uncharacterized protein YaiE (UPF0345 family)